MEFCFLQRHLSSWEMLLLWNVVAHLSLRDELMASYNRKNLILKALNFLLSKKAWDDVEELSSHFFFEIFQFQCKVGECLIQPKLDISCLSYRRCSCCCTTKSTKYKISRYEIHFNWSQCNRIEKSTRLISSDESAQHSTWTFNVQHCHNSFRYLALHRLYPVDSWLKMQMK